MKSRKGSQWLEGQGAIATYCGVTERTVRRWCEPSWPTPMPVVRDVVGRVKITEAALSEWLDAEERRRKQK